MANTGFGPANHTTEVTKMKNDPQQNLSRRGLIRSGAAAVMGAGIAGARVASAATRGNIKHSVAYWCFSVEPWNWSLDKLCAVSKSLGAESIEVLLPQDWPTLKKHGLKCALASNGMTEPAFVKGLNNPRYQEEVVATTIKTIEQCPDWGVPNVIAFTGMRWRDAEDPASGEIPLAEGAGNCVKGLKELARHGEKHGVTLCLEMLNTRDDSHPMKGHPGYQGNNMEYCAEIVRRVDSPRVKLLFDIYHLQVMQGDVIRRIRRYKDLIGHVHTAGCPGRGELDVRQEINYPAVMHALLEIGYKGYVGHEFIPTREPVQSLTEAIRFCDV